MLNRIWAPWRAQYIQAASASPQPIGSAFLCRGLASDQDRQNLVVERAREFIRRLEPLSL